MKLALGVATHYASVLKHKGWVAFYLVRYWSAPGNPDHATVLLRRAVVHDLSKFRWDEAKGFAQTVNELAAVKYGSEEYKALVQKILPSIQRHYQRNRHHPEFHEGGYAQMGDWDVIEMVADWAAAVRRHDDGDLERSIRINQKRFKFLDEDAEEIRAIARLMGALPKAARREPELSESGL